MKISFLRKGRTGDPNTLRFENTSCKTKGDNIVWAQIMNRLECQVHNIINERANNIPDLFTNIISSLCIF